MTATTHPTQSSGSQTFFVARAVEVDLANHEQYRARPVAARAPSGRRIGRGHGRELAHAKRRFGLSADAPVRGCSRSRP